MKRIAAIDILRALTMLWMLFVNDIPALQGVPHWLFHAEAKEDMLGFSDLVFPAFLFCVGMSIPFAIDSRLKRGSSMGAIIGHVLQRSFALIVMGLFLLNRHKGEEGIASNYMLLMSVAGFFLIWTDYPPKHQRLFRLMRYAGVALLAGLMLYCDITGHPFEIGWWGILGLIGWTYLVCTLAYLIVCNWHVSAWLMWLLFVMLCVLTLRPWWLDSSFYRFLGRGSFIAFETADCQWPQLATCRYVCTFRIGGSWVWHRVAPMVDYLQDPSYTDMAVLFFDRQFLVVGSGVLSFRYLWQETVVCFDSPSRLSHTDVLSDTLYLVSLTRVIRHQYSWLVWVGWYSHITGLCSPYHPDHSSVRICRPESEVVNQ